MDLPPQLSDRQWAEFCAMGRMLEEKDAEIARLQAQGRELVYENVRLKDFLADMEWADGPGDCPWCGNHRSDGHRAGCGMAQMLKGDLKDADPKRT